MKKIRNKEMLMTDKNMKMEDSVHWDSAHLQQKFKNCLNAQQKIYDQKFYLNIFNCCVGQ